MLHVVIFLVSLGARAIRAICHRRGDLVIENLTLRQQLAVVKKERPRPPLEDTDRKNTPNGGREISRYACGFCRNAAVSARMSSRFLWHDALDEGVIVRQQPGAWKPWFELSLAARRVVVD